MPREMAPGHLVACHYPLSEPVAPEAAAASASVSQ